MFEDAAIVRFYYYMENGSKLMKIKYSCDENGNVSLGDIVEVRVAYEEVVDVSNTATEVEEVGVENATETIEENAEIQESELAKKDEEEKGKCLESESELAKKDEEEKPCMFACQMKMSGSPRNNIGLCSEFLLMCFYYLFHKIPPFFIKENHQDTVRFQSLPYYIEFFKLC